MEKCFPFENLPSQMGICTVCGKEQVLNPTGLIDSHWTWTREGTHGTLCSGRYLAPLGKQEAQLVPEE